ncbi:MAG: hypothetical protein JOY99_07260 [Sphingomonadaceae bacterium]|nr:hypothetical protein [Sphingomonadaceae bacterium]
MSRRTKVLLLSSGALLVFLPTRAFAGDAECVWNHLSAAAHQSVFAAYEQGGVDALDQAQIDDTAVIASFRACTRNPSAIPSRAIGPALVGASLEHAATSHLKVAEGVSPARLDRAWRGLTPTEQQSLRTAYLTSDADIPRATIAAIDKAVGMAGYKLAPGAHVIGDPRYRHYADYFEGRAQREAYEQRF